MTNEEKAKEIYNITYKQCIEDSYPEIVSKTCAIMSKTGAEIMAEWKERQMIEKAQDFLANWFYEHPHTKMVCSDEFESVEDLLERFKKAMEE